MVQPCFVEIKSSLFELLHADKISTIRDGASVIWDNKMLQQPFKKYVKMIETFIY